MACNPRASVSQERISLIEEVTCATTPASPAYQIVPHLAGSRLQVQRSFEETQEIDSTRQGGKLLPGTKAIAGPILTNLVNEPAFDSLMKSAISAALAAVNLTVSVSFDSGTKKATRASGSFLTDPYNTRLQVGDKVAPVGAASNKTTLNGGITSSDTSIILTSAASFPSSGVIAINTSGTVEFVKYTGKSTNTLTGCSRGAWDSVAASHSNGDSVYPVFTITAINATELTFGGDTVATESAVSTTFMSNRKRAASSTTRTRFSIEKANLDRSLFQTFKGAEVNDVEIVIGLGQGQATFNMIGQTNTTAQESGATYLPKRGSAPMTGTVNGTLLTEAGATLAGCRQATIRLTNQREGQFQIGSDETDHVSEGNFGVEVQMEIYRGDLARLNNYLNGVRQPFVYQVKEPSSGDALRWTLPNAVYRQADEGAAGQTITENCTLYAEKDDAATGSKMIFEKIFG
jgi:hypothetical protein